MFRLDDQFLKDIGLEGLPDEQKKPFLQHIYSELELRVGTRLSDGLSDAQLEEFEKIIDRDQEKIQSWLAENAPAYTQDEAFVKLQQATELDANDPRLVAEYTATKWLEVNRSDYRQVVADVLGELKREIMSNRDAILGGIAEQPTPPDETPNQPPQAA
jgi:succinate dehydrogenase flavin-adding protein (antitoxin of CptAB toxin-antitoxin module)